MSFELDIKKSDFLDGVFIIKPSIFEDKRGNIWTSFLKNEIDRLLPNNLSFIHDKFSLSKNNVLRGIHGDEKSWKLVTCVFGNILQAVIMKKLSKKKINLKQKKYLEDAMMTSIAGISAAMKNTG